MVDFGQARTSSLAAVAVLSLVGVASTSCGGSDTDGSAPPKTSAGTTSPAAPNSLVTRDGSWAGSTSSREAFSFTVRADTVYEVTIPKMPCGVGIPSTVEGGVPVEQDAFQVESVPLPYLLYSKAGGQPVQAQDEVTVKGTFEGEKAKGTITVKVVTDKGVADSCQDTWTASRS